MTFIPDPIEILESQIENNINNYIEGHCMSCGKEVDYELIQTNPSPSTPAVCFECLSPDDQKAYEDSCKNDRI